MSDTQTTGREAAGSFRPRARVLLACAVVFLAAAGVRLLHAQDNRQALPFYGMTGEYKAHALMLVRGDLKGFLRGADPPSDADVVKHPPGYPLLMAAVYALFGESDAGLQLVHVALDALAAVLVLLIARELFSFAVGVLAGSLVALSPQLAYHSIALLPDPLATPPLLLAFYLLARTRRRPRVLTALAAGALVGASCWLRSNAMLLPFFVAALAPLLFPAGRRLRTAAAVVAGALLLMVPVTVRNYLAFRSFIPLSLSAGITLVEGIGVSDPGGRLGLPSTDIGVTQWEARIYGRPDYLCGRFAPDGVERERRRVGHALRVVREHPLWFLGVMARRASDMPRLARVEVVAAEPAATRPLAPSDGARPAWSLAPEELYAKVGADAGALSLVSVEAPAAAPGAAGTTGAQPDCGGHVTPMQYTSALHDPSIEAGGRALRFEGSAAREMFASQPLPIAPGKDYLLRLPLKIEEGSVVVELRDARRGTLLASTPVLHPVKWAELPPGVQPFVRVERPFVSGDAEQVRVVFRNGGRKPAAIAVEAGRVEAFDLGPSSYIWTRYPRAILRGVQRLFLTALVLPLVFAGVAALVVSRRFGALALLLVVPAYYMCVQSALWTEFRYVLPMHYFLLILAAAGLAWLARRAALALSSRPAAQPEARP